MESAARSSITTTAGSRSKTKQLTRRGVKKPQSTDQSHTFLKVRHIHFKLLQLVVKVQAREMVETHEDYKLSVRAGGE